MYFLRSGPRSFVQDLYAWDGARRRERRLASAVALLSGGQESLPREERSRRERQRIATRGIATYGLSRDGRRLLVPIGRRLFVVDAASGRATELPIPGEGAAIDPSFSPDGRRVAYVREDDLYVMDIASGAERRLTSGASETLTHALAEFVAQEEMDRYHGYWWSPDGTTIAYEEADTRGVELFEVSDPAHPEHGAETWRYPRPGMANAEVRLGVVPADSGATTWVEWDRARWPYFATVVWGENAPLTLLVQNREQTEEALLSVDVATGRTTSLLTETDDAWLNIPPGMPQWFHDGSAFLWMTERGGGWQLELRGRDGALVRTITSVDLGLHSVAGVDEARGVVWVIASSDPTESHLFRIPLDPARGPPLSRLEAHPGVEGGIFGERTDVFVHTVSPLHGPARWLVRRFDGGVVGELRSVAEQPPFVAQADLVTLDDSLHLRAVVVRPRDFSPGRRYPVIDHDYGGPLSQMVQASESRYVLDQWLADHGFVVVSIDGRGTPARGRAWERAIRGDLATIPLADQVEGIRALAARFPEMDTSHVGIWGWSFGGYLAALAVMRRPDVFRSAVAGAPVTDWLDYDTHYTERYLGLPAANPDGYARGSLIAAAPQLARPLLIIHGTADDNVHFVNSIKLCDALYRAGRPFEFLPLASFTHMVADPVETRRLNERILSHFEETLGRAVDRP